MKQQKNQKRMFNLLIVDMSGSMSIIRSQALAGLNETLSTIQDMQHAHPELKQSVTLINFNSAYTTTIYDNTPADHTRLLTTDDYRPAGATPLYDAIGHGIAKINAQTTADDNVLVTIITDGQENCSREYNLCMIKNLIEKLKAQNWTFTFIGTDNLDVESMAHSMNIENHLAFRQDKEGTENMFLRECRARMRHYDMICDDQAMAQADYFNIDDEDDKH